MKSCPPSASLGSSPGDAETRVHAPRRGARRHAGGRGARATPRDAAPRMPRVTARSELRFQSARFCWTELFAACETLSAGGSQSDPRADPRLTRVSQTAHCQNIKLLKASAVPSGRAGQRGVRGLRTHAMSTSTTRASMASTASSSTTRGGAFGRRVGEATGSRAGARRGPRVPAGAGRARPARRPRVSVVTYARAGADDADVSKDASAPRRLKIFSVNDGASPREARER